MESDRVLSSKPLSFTGSPVRLQDTATVHVMEYLYSEFFQFEDTTESAKTSCECLGTAIPFPSSSTLPQLRLVQNKRAILNPNERRPLPPEWQCHVLTSTNCSPKKVGLVHDSGFSSVRECSLCCRGK